MDKCKGAYNSTLIHEKRIGMRGAKEVLAGTFRGGKQGIRRENELDVQ